MSTPIAALPFFGGTLACFDPSDNTVIEVTTAGTYDATFSTSALYVNGNTVSYATSPTWAAAATFWMHAVTWLYWPGVTVVETDNLDFLNASTVVAKLTCEIIAGPTIAKYRLYTLQSGTLTLVGTVTIPVATRQTLDFNIVGNTATGSAAMYIAGVQAFSVTGLNHAGFTGVTEVKLWGGPTAAAITCPTYWSQVMCDSTSTTGRFLRTDRLNTNSGTNTGWTGTVTDINEIPTSDANFISAASANLVSTFYETGLNLGTYQILARGVGARMRKQDVSGPQNIQLAIRSGGNNFVSSTIAAGVAFQAAFNSWTTDPNTSAAWTDSNAASAESGVKSIT